MDDPMIRSRLGRIYGTRLKGAAEPKLLPPLFFSQTFSTQIPFSRLRWCGVSLGPYGREDQRHSNPDRDFGEPMKRDSPCWARSRYQQHNRQGNTPEPVGASVRAHRGANESQDEHANTEHKHARSEVAG